MNPSIFIDYVRKWFAGVVVIFLAKINEKPYLFRSILTPDESLDGTFKSISDSYSNVAADMVALDSPLPLKSRPAISQANGEIPKVGMKKRLNENQLKAIQIMVALGRDAISVVSKLFQDMQACLIGVYERNEYTLLQALSTGYAEINDPENVGLSYRFNYNIPAANKFGADTAIWGAAGSDPMGDILRVYEAASATGGVTKIYMDRGAFNKLAASDGAKQLFAASINFAGQAIPAPTIQGLNAALMTNYGFEIVLVDRTSYIEKNGVITPVKAWEDGQVTFVRDAIVGTLAYSQVAEFSNRLPQVEYQVADGYILLSKYGFNDPLTEVSSSQAQVVPVLQNVNTIYMLDTKTVQA